MKRMLVLLLAIMLCSIGTASAQQLFDFDAQVNLPASVGGSLEMYGVIVNGGIVDTPLPIDYLNFEYTIVITGLVWVTDAFSDEYAGGTIAIYKDDSTAADYTNTATFTDGTAILSGTFQNLARTIFFPSSGTGSASGLVDWTGGSRIDELAFADRIGWAFVTGIGGGATVEPGYDEHWDGKVEPLNPIVGVENQSFGGLKSSY